MKKLLEKGDKIEFYLSESEGNYEKGKGRFIEFISVPSRNNFDDNEIVKAIVQTDEADIKIMKPCLIILL